jgi:signal transduction histidine kinase/CheY-like chemotaxis protein
VKEIPEKLFRELADDLDVAVFITDADGIVHDLNEQASSIVRLPRITASGRNLARILPREVADYLVGSGTDALATGRIQRNAKLSMVLPGRGFRYFDVRVIPYRNSPGGPWLANVLLDITNRERRELASETARENAEAEARARRAFLARMSHEIRTPMNGIIGMTDLALQAGPEGEIGEYLGIIRNAADSLLEIINDVLDFAKVESGKMELEQLPVNLNTLVQDTLTLLLPTAEEKGIRLSGTVDSGLPENLVGDSGRIRQILMNLLGNAIKFTGTGEVKLRLSPGPRVPDSSMDEVILAGEVSDTGIGIPPEKLGMLFDPFTQGDAGISRQYGGTGLGLAICRTLAHLMGGDIDVESSPGEGSVFRFHIRLKEANEEGEAGVHNPEDNSDSALNGNRAQGLYSNRWNGESVLLAEDNRVNHIVAERLLSRAGLRVISCKDGLEALRAWEDNRPALVILDIQMPVMDGLTAARRIREIEKQEGKGKSVPIIALTAHVLEEERNSAIDAGMDGWVSKPVKPAVLYAEIARVLPPVRSRAAIEG